MKKQKLAALILALTLCVMPGIVRAENTETPASESTQTAAPATETPAPATDTPAPATDTPAPATDTPAPATNTPAPATDTPAPATNTPAPATATPRPSYPRAWFDASMAIVDTSAAYQDGKLIVALPIAIETQEGTRIYSNAAGSQSGWTPQSDSTPFYFAQDIMALPIGAGWELDSASGAALNALFDLSAASVRDMIAYAPENNNWNMAAKTPYNAGYAVFNLDISENAPVGRYQLKFVYDGGDELMNDQKIEFTLEFSIAANPNATPTPTIAPSDAPTVSPADDPTDEPSGDGSVMIGQMAVETLKVGQSGVTLAIPVSYADDITRVYSNRDDEGNLLKPGSEGFSDEILNYIERLDIEITAESAADPAFPFLLSEQGVTRAVIEDGVNHGYAVFSNLTVKSGLSNGTVAVPFTARYTDAITGETHSVELSALVNITGAKTSGGGGGGGSYVAPTTAPQARVIVESISTDPESVQAGDTFNLVLMLRNTSDKQYVQNMRVTIDTENDVLIPQSGSNTVYIDRIDAQGLYELRYPVRANLEVPDRPLKVEVSIEYEDSAVSAQTAAQQLVVSVAQKMRLSVSDPVMDASSLYAGDSLDVTLQVVNEGRTTLYNVSVTPVSNDKNLTLPTAAYLGNMEGGTAKKAELSLTPSEAGDYQADLIVSWEDALGEKYSEKRSVSFSAQADETIDYSGSTGGNPTDYYSSDIPGNSVDPEPESDASALLSMMPWWVYAAAAGLYFVIVIYAAMSVRSRRRKALEDDEMD